MFGKHAAILLNDFDDLNALARAIYQIVSSPVELYHEGNVTVIGDVTMDGEVNSLRWAVARFDAEIIPYATEPNASYIDCWEATGKAGGLTDVPVRVYLPATGANELCFFDPPAIEAGSVLAYQYDINGQAIAYTLSAMDPVVRVARADEDMMWGTTSAGAGPYLATLQHPVFSGATPVYTPTTRQVNVYSACRNSCTSGDYILLNREVCSKENELWLFLGIVGDPDHVGGYAPPVEFHNQEVSLLEFQ